MLCCWTLLREGDIHCLGSSWFHSPSVCVRLEVTVTSLHPPLLCRIAVLSMKPNFLPPFPDCTPNGCSLLFSFLSLCSFCLASRSFSYNPTSLSLPLSMPASMNDHVPRRQAPHLELPHHPHARLHMARPPPGIKQGRRRLGALEPPPHSPQPPYVDRSIEI